MKENNKEEFNFITHALTDAEKHLGIPKQAILNLISKNEDDWSFIIKLSAFVEQLVNFLLCQDVNDLPIKNLIQSQTLNKKIDLAKELELIDSEIASKFKFIGKLRNDAAHNITFKFFPNIERFNHYKSLFSNAWVDGVELNGIPINNKSMTAENPRITLFFDCLGCLSLMSLNQKHAKYLKDFEKQKEIRDAQKEIFEAFKKGLSIEEE